MDELWISVISGLLAAGTTAVGFLYRDWRQGAAERERHSLGHREGAHRALMDAHQALLRGLDTMSGDLGNAIDWTRVGWEDDLREAKYAISVSAPFLSPRLQPRVLALVREIDDLVRAIGAIKDQRLRRWNDLEPELEYAEQLKEDNRLIGDARDAIADWHKTVIRGLS